MKTTLDILTLARSGVNLVVDASSKTTMDLLNIVNAVVQSGAHITLKNCNLKMTSDLLKICVLSPKNITLDLS